MRPNIKFRGFDKFFLVMFTILGQPFFFLSHVFLFRNWFQVYIALRDTWVRDSGTPGSCFFHIVCPSFEGSSAQIPGHWGLCHPWVLLGVWAFWASQTQASATAVTLQIIPGYLWQGFDFHALCGPGYGFMLQSLLYLIANKYRSWKSLKRCLF